MYTDSKGRSQIEEINGSVIQAASSWDLVCDVRSDAEFKVPDSTLPTLLCVCVCVCAANE